MRTKVVRSSELWSRTTCLVLTPNTVVGVKVTMARDVFPFELDRLVIEHFLLGRTAAKSDFLNISKQSLIFDPGTVVAWFAETDGALYGKLSHGIAVHYAMRTLNHIQELLGVEDRSLTREVKPRIVDKAPGVRVRNGETIRLFMGGQPLEPDQPVLILGPTGVLAYRASRGVKSKR